MDILLTKEQVEFAKEHFKNFLANSTEFGGKSVILENVKNFIYDGKTFIIFKFREEKEGIWLLGVCGGFIPGMIDDSGCAWSEFECFDEETCDQKCKQYIETFKENHPDYIFRYLDLLKNYSKWDEMIKVVDDNISKYYMKREENGQKCYQFFNANDFYYYATMNKDEQFTWVKADEAVLLQRKLYALIELKDENGSQAVLDELNELVPFCASNMFEQVEIYKKLGKLSLYREKLENIYPYIWRAYDFARYLRANSWVDIEEGKYERAKHYLSWSLFYDTSERSFNYANGELKYIKDKMGLESIDRPSIAESHKFFIENKMHKDIMQQNIGFSYNLYEFYLKNKNVRLADVNFARQNLRDLGRVIGTSEIDVKMVEVNVNTPNKLVVNFPYHISFQILKEYTAVNNLDNNICQVFMYDDRNAQISLKDIGEYDSKEQYKDLIEKDINKYRGEGANILSIEDKSFENGKSYKKMIYTLAGMTKVNCYCKINEKVAGVVIATYTNDDDAIMQEVEKILNTIEAF